MINRRTKSISFQTICCALNGDEMAMCDVISHYKPYIKTLATRELKDDFGNVFYYVDDTVIARLEAKLICSIIKNFKILSA